MGYKYGGGYYGGSYGCRFDFSLLVVLFILLIIVGTHFHSKGY
ncbi:MAG: YjcZ family sporulation protein [Lysinibacillus sp.]|nr:YjcZ family sporulation protein [Lysinibacillus sp.]